MPNTVISMLFSTARAHYDSASHEDILELMDAAVLRIMFTFFADLYGFCALRNIEGSLDTPNRRYQICSIFQPIVTHTFLIIAPYITENYIPDLIDEDFISSLNAPSLLPSPHWVMLVSGAQDIRVRFIHYRPVTENGEERLRPVFLDEPTGIFVETTIDYSQGLIDGEDLVDQMLQELALRDASHTTILCVEKLEKPCGPVQSVYYCSGHYESTVQKLNKVNGFGYGTTDIDGFSRCLSALGTLGDTGVCQHTK